jgi:hypothetical protein
MTFEVLSEKQTLFIHVLVSRLYLILYLAIYLLFLFKRCLDTVYKNCKMFNQQIKAETNSLLLPNAVSKSCDKPKHRFWNSWTPTYSPFPNSDV